MTSPALTPDLARLRSMFDEIIASSPIPDDVRTRELEFGGRPVLEVVIDGIETHGTLVWIHGGAFIAGSARIALAPAAAIARASRMRVLSIDYRLAPEHPFPAALDDLHSAWHAIVASTEGPIVLGGESAGGALALAVLLGLRDRGLALPPAAVVFSPVTDLTVSGATLITKRDVDPVITAEIVRTGAEAYLAGHDARDPLASPLFAELTGLPPLLIQVGGFEALLDDSLRLAARAADQGLDVALDVAAGMTHVFPAHDSPAAALALEHAGWFLRSRAGL